MSASSVTSYPRLLKTLATEQKIVYLCGAGASMSLSDHKLNWPNWILAGKKYLIPAEQNELDRRIGGWSSNELIKAATYLLERLKDSHSYNDFMNSTVGSLHPVEANFIDALRKIWRAGDLITTTNYDRSIEEAVDVNSVSYSTPAEILSIIQGDAENRVIHLHGVYDVFHGIDDIVADDPQYNNVLANAGAQFIQNLISTHPIIIVGCGGTVEDPNLSGFMNFVVDKLGASNIPYFYLMKNGDSVPALPPNAIPIFYGDDYTDLPMFLAEMAAMRLRRRAGIRSVVAVNPYADRTPVTSAFGRIHFSNEFSDFIGRKAELDSIKDFIKDDRKILWWSVTGEGGIGKSRLVMESLRNAPSNWFGFFTRKNAAEMGAFLPFTDTVIVFDYVLGSEHECVECLEAYLDVFESSPYKLRIIFIERAQKTDEWIKVIKRGLDSENRLTFEGAEYRKDALRITALTDDEEILYIKSYLKSYMPLIEKIDFADRCGSDLDGFSGRIQKSFRESVDADCYRPLYLSIFIEVWIGKEGELSLSSSEELLEEYLERETNRWKNILNDSDELVTSYLNLLAMACAIGQFNITDVNGANYLIKDCEDLTAFFDDNMRKAGFENTKADLSVFMDELEEYDASEDPIIEAFNNPHEADELSDGILDEEDIKPVMSLDQEDRFAYYCPYVKLHADPDEVYLNMLGNAGLLDEAEKVQLKELHEKNVAKVKAMPDHAWIIEATLPDIIRGFIVRYIVRPYDIVKFTKLARSNSILELSHFLNLVLSDNTDNDLFQKIAITPPDEILNYFEYYVSLLVSIEGIQDIKSVEDALCHVDPIFPKYEIELWNRIAHTLEKRGDIDRLFDSACNYIDYIKQFSEYLPIRDEMADVLKQYCVAIHNAGEEAKFIEYVGMIDNAEELLPKTSKFGQVICENYRVIIDGKFMNGKDFSREWSRIQETVDGYEYSEGFLDIAMKAANDWMLSLNRKKDIDGLKAHESYLEGLYEVHKSEAVAEVLALTTANIYTVTFMAKGRQLHEQYNKLKEYLKDFRDNMHVRSAYISVCREEYLETAKFRKVPDSVIRNAELWSKQYPDEIEFQEAYFQLLAAKLEYAQTHDMRNEQKRVFREMKLVAENTDYEAYHEENAMKETVEILQRFFR